MSGFAPLQFILSSFLPVLGLVLTVALLGYGAYVLWIDLPQKWLLSRRALLALCAVALLCDVWLGLRLYLSHSERQGWKDGAVYRASRERFALPQDFQYGELLIPAGSLINRQDPFDKGEPVRPVALHGLEAVRFSQPVLVAGVWASALQITPLRVELAQDQRIGPLYRYDSARQGWVPNKVVPALACKKGQIAVFQVPHIPYDVQAEVGKPAPDGPEARFMPSQWMFRNCEVGAPIAVQPAQASTPAPQ
ncbi:hypothetical protein [Paracidovorax valerianellae]|uniref:Uncharacterized protein n=1 Tax=Paracidovorax valerianellae TaxID=187868 RepID=A0A1G6SAV3_9BURK|nr:hypothetical protein [Paracidovorax valerianellae]MDA8444235.1 hypothetical protein [Paracidovorax valerianellae]SDD13801.1 hypothetical protein SAMN05192589_104387 [Paracidovorax valerianellae]